MGCISQTDYFSGEMQRGKNAKVYAYRIAIYAR